VDPGGWLNGSNLRKCAGQGTIVIASGRRGRGFKSRHPDAKTAAQRLWAIEWRWSWVTNCVTIGSFSRGASLTLRPSRRFTVVIVCGPGFGDRDPTDNRDAKPTTLIHSANSKTSRSGHSTLMSAGGRRPRARRGSLCGAWQCARDHRGDRLRQMPVVGRALRSGRSGHEGGLAFIDCGHMRRAVVLC
jgi:hypothetical protein